MCQVGVVALGIYLFALDHSVDEARKWTTLFVEAESEFLRSVLPGETVTIRGERIFWRRHKLRCARRDVRAPTARWWRRRRRRDWGSAMAERVVVTGMGIVAANAHGLDAFEQALREGRSGIRFHEKLRDLGFGCQVGGVPDISDELKHQLLLRGDAARAEQQHGLREHRGDRLLAGRRLRRAGAGLRRGGLGHRRHHRDGHRRRGHGRRVGGAAGQRGQGPPAGQHLGRADDGQLGQRLRRRAASRSAAR